MKKKYRVLSIIGVAAILGYIFYKKNKSIRISDGVIPVPDTLTDATITVVSDDEIVVSGSQTGTINKVLYGSTGIVPEFYKSDSQYSHLSCYPNCAIDDNGKVIGYYSNNGELILNSDIRFGKTPEQIAAIAAAMQKRRKDVQYVRQQAMQDRGENRMAMTQIMNAPMPSYTGGWTANNPFPNFEFNRLTTWHPINALDTGGGGQFVNGSYKSAIGTSRYF